MTHAQAQLLERNNPVTRYRNLRVAGFSPADAFDIASKRFAQDQDHRIRLLVAAEITLDELWDKMKAWDGVTSDVGYVPTLDNPYAKQFDTVMRQRGGITRKIK